MWHDILFFIYVDAYEARVTAWNISPEQAAQTTEKRDFTWAGMNQTGNPE